MEEFVVRKAVLADIETLYAFEQGIIAAERPFDTTLDQDPIHYYDLKELVQAPDALILLAWDGPRIVGSGFAHIREAKPYLHHTHYAHLGFMYTDPAYRGKGINRIIMKGLLDWSCGQGITESRLTVYDGNASAIRAYEKMGFTRHIVEMRATVEAKNKVQE